MVRKNGRNILGRRGDIIDLYPTYLCTDDEATESSSGGESADEQEKFAPNAASYAPIKERAKYRYLKKVCMH